jgi:hypothetical protein
MRTMLAVVISGLVLLALSENARAAPIAPLAPGVTAAISDVTEASCGVDAGAIAGDGCSAAGAGGIAGVACAAGNSLRPSLVLITLRLVCRARRL